MTDVGGYYKDDRHFTEEELAEKRNKGFIGMAGNTDNGLFLARLLKSDAATAKLQADLQAEAEVLFAKMADAFGDDGARSAWNEIAKRKRGAPKGPRDEKTETFLVTLWKEHRQLHPEASRHGAALVVAGGLEKSLPKVWKRFNATAEALAKRIVDAAARAE